ncbi:MAG: cyclic nucleotide-binding domain-containing protein [Anaerolineae bacterium]|nr:cyclic nucleotide-binding domain-containing protein [Anaerolineae bacterium]
MPSQEEIIRTLQGVPLFSRLSRSQLRKMVGLVREATYSPGETICVQGEPGHRYYILRSGLVRATRVDPEGRVAEVKRLGAGNAFGETSLLLGDVHDVTLEVLEPTTIWYLEREEFEKSWPPTPPLNEPSRCGPTWRNGGGIPVSAG